MQTNHSIELLTMADIDAISHLEQAVWPAHMAACRETLCERFSQGHSMLGAMYDGQLIGLASYRLAHLDIAARDQFPSTFSAFSTGSPATDFNAAFVYNLGIHPARRGTPMTSQLVHAVLTTARDAGCDYVVGDGRCPSYNGSLEDNIAQRLAFKKALDAHMFNNKPLNTDDYLMDPVLNFYYRILDCKFLWAIPNFMPADTASGGHRVIFMKSL